MNKRITCLVALIGLMALACDNEGGGVILPENPSGSGSGGGTQTTGTALEFYINEVHPALDLTCTWCHAAVEAGELAPGEAPQWMSLDPATSYSKIEEYGSLIAHPANSLLILQGEHMGPMLQPKQEELVREWLLMEVEERGLPTPSDPPDNPMGPPAASAEEALQQFSECMTREVWDQYEMNLIAHSQTLGWGPCRGCHNRGWAGAFLDDDETLTYDQSRQRPFLLKYVTAKISDEGAFEDIVPSNRMLNKGTETCSYDDVSACHPRYTLLPNVTTNIEGFIAEVHTRWINGNCDAPLGMGGMGGGGGAGGAGGGQ